MFDILLEARIKVFELMGEMSGHISMDQEKIHEAEEGVRHWLADGHHRRCCRLALGVANAVMLMGLTAGMAMLCLMELRKARCCHKHCCKSDGEK